MSHAHYTVVEFDEALVLIDLAGPDERTITNDAEAVIAELAAAGRPVDAKVIIYLGSDERWDGLAVKDGAFAGFVLLNAKGPRRAIAAMKERQR